MKAAALLLAAVLACSGGWPSGGHDEQNTRNNPAAREIGPDAARTLAVKWTYRTQGDVSATPAVVAGAVYFPDWGGYLHKVDSRTGKKVWSRRISDYTGRAGSLSRTSPAVRDGVVYVGEQVGGRLMAVSAATGRLIWLRQLDDHPYASLTASPILVGNTVLQPVSSQEAGAAEDPNYVCCTFRGSMTALDARTGRLLWQTYTVPDNGGEPGGYSGASIWGAPAVDPARRRVYVTTGNNYMVPKEVKDCQLGGGTPAECQSPDNHVDSILALDLRTGKIVWNQGTEGFDDWTNACLPGLPPNNCPINHGPDADLGTGAQVFRINGRLAVGAGQKNGMYWALDARTGEIIWSAAVAPGGPLGGIMWGAAVDGRRIYVAATNFGRQPHTLPDGSTITTGSFAALDAATGRFVWQIADPSGGMGMGAVSTANGVVYAGSTSGHMYALHAHTGEVLFDHLGEGTSNAGAAISGGTVFWGNGYENIPIGRGPSTTFYAFSPRAR